MSCVIGMKAALMFFGFFFTFFPGGLANSHLLASIPPTEDAEDMWNQQTTSFNLILRLHHWAADHTQKKVLSHRHPQLARIIVIARG